MKPTRLATVLVVLALASVVLAAGQSGPPASDEGNVVIQVSPRVLVLHEQGTWVTVHATIELSSVNTATVRLNGLEPDVIKADDRGDMVLKIRQERLDAEPPALDIVVTGTTKTGEAIYATQTIRVQVK